MSPRGARRFFLLPLLLLPPFALMAAFVWSLLVPVDLAARLEAVKRASVVLDRSGREITTLYASGRVWAPLARIPVFLREAVIATEDVRFYRHRGVDLRGIARALYEDLRRREVVQGGSTITQQLAKISMLTAERTVWRKVADIALALRIERQYSKDQILQFYLNQVYLGHGAVGVEAAAQIYFGRHVWEINRREGAMLAGLIRGPEYYTPFRRRKIAEARTSTVLALMEQTGRLTREERLAVAKEPLRLLSSPGHSYPGGYFVAQVVAELRRRYGWSEEYIRRGGLEIRTTMDVAQQRAAEDAIRLLPVAYRDPDGTAQPQGALVALDPGNGAVRALVGGRDYLASPLNRATRARRQPGSAIKPFVFAAAMENGYTPDSIFLDAPTEFRVNGRPWRPRNYDQKYRGPITLRRALEESVNVVSARLVEVLGPRTVFELARRMGLGGLVGSGKRNDIGLAPLALGGLTLGVTPLELTTAFAAFANGGQRVEPFLFTTVTDRRGNVVVRDGPRRQRVISSYAAYQVADMMRGVITRGTGVRAAIGRPAAGKTGTTTDYTNGWFVGFTPDLVAGVWIGNDVADKPMRTKEGNLGSGLAAALWGFFMDRALAGSPPRDFLPPSAVVPAAGARTMDRTVTLRPFFTAWWQLVRQKLAALAGLYRLRDRRPGAGGKEQRLRGVAPGHPR